MPPDHFDTSELSRPEGDAERAGYDGRSWPRYVEDPYASRHGKLRGLDLRVLTEAVYGEWLATCRPPTFDRASELTGYGAQKLRNAAKDGLLRGLLQETKVWTGVTQSGYGGPEGRGQIHMTRLTGALLPTHAYLGWKLRDENRTK